VRPIVEDSLGHDTMFYNVLETAMANGLYLEDIFGSQDHYFKHAFVKRTHLCHRIFAVGDYVVKELQFLGPQLASKDIDLVYNGIPHIPISLEEKHVSKAKLQRYTKALLGYSPDLVFTHVTRLVKSKGIWRDLRVLEHLDEFLRYDGKKAVMFLLSTLVGSGRPPEDILKMEREYGWPLDHRQGWPDLEGYESDLHAGILSFNQRATNLRIIFVNQFGWNRDRCGLRMPENMEFADIRKGPDVEFGQSVYEPFGIAQLEPLSFGAICVPTNVCGCTGFVRKVIPRAGVKNVIVADYTTLPLRPRSLWDMLAIGLRERNEVEALNSMKVASMIYAFLPRNVADEEAMVKKGSELASQMTWEVVARDYFLPGLQKA
jgi:glycosyltransferase involved in cell wall biosynthesis